MKKAFLFVTVCSAIIISCTSIDVFEKDIPIKDHAWQSTFKPSMVFSITDTASYYNIYIMIRHSDAYNYNNLWLNIYTKSPGEPVKKQPLELQLANNQKGWLGSGMDDIFEHRIRITSSPIRFKKPGDYEFSLEQIMREDPLENVFNIGLRIEKVNQ